MTAQKYQAIIARLITDGRVAGAGCVELKRLNTVGRVIVAAAVQ